MIRGRNLMFFMVAQTLQVLSSQSNMDRASRPASVIAVLDEPYKPFCSSEADVSSTVKYVCLYNSWNYNENVNRSYFDQFFPS